MATTTPSRWHVAYVTESVVVTTTFSEVESISTSEDVALVDMVVGVSPIAE